LASIGNPHSAHRHVGHDNWRSCSNASNNGHTAARQKYSAYAQSAPYFSPLINRPSKVRVAAIASQAIAETPAFLKAICFEKQLHRPDTTPASTDPRFSVHRWVRRGAAPGGRWAINCAGQPTAVAGSCQQKHLKTTSGNDIGQQGDGQPSEAIGPSGCRIRTIRQLNFWRMHLASDVIRQPFE